MGFVLVTRVFEVFDGDIEIELGGDIGDRLREFDDADRAGNLIVDDMIIGSRIGLRERKLCEPFNGILERDEGFALFTLSVDGHRVAGDRLRAEPVGDDAKVVVEIEACRQTWIRGGFRSFGSVGDRRPNIGNGDIELVVREAHVRRVVALGEMVPAAGHRGERYLVALALMLHRCPAFRNRELGSAVDAGRRRLDEMGVGQIVFLESPE